MIYIFLYLTSIILANLAIARFGPAAAIWDAFLFIGLDLTSRDKLHESWSGSHLALKMSILIGTGSLLSWLLNRSSGQIALASFLAFACAATVDTITYQLLKDRFYLIKVNGSNLFSSLTDSLIFPSLAFGAFLPAIILGQFLAKFVGGFVWSIVLSKGSKIDRA